MNQLDIRLPMGIMFSMLGSILVVYGALAGKHVRMFGLDINLLWGAFILSFGVVMLVLAIRARRKAALSFSTSRN